MNTTGWIIGILVTVGLLVGIVLFDSSQQRTSTTIPDSVTQIQDADWVDGPTEAKVTLIEYGDFQCPACAYFATLVDQLRNDYPDDLRVVFRQFPLKSIHPNAELAARASEAAGLQDKFWPMYYKLYEQQAQWSDANNPADHFVQYAQEIGLDTDRFKADLIANPTKDAVNEDLQSGNGAGINATPTFIINGTKIPVPKNYNEFKERIDAALQ